MDRIRRLRAPLWMAVALVAVVGLLQLIGPSTVQANIIEMSGEDSDSQTAVVQWVDSDGTVREQVVSIPPRYLGATEVPIVVNNQFALYVHDGAFPIWLYPVAAFLGFLLGGPISKAFRTSPGSRSVPRETTWMAGV